MLSWQHDARTVSIWTVDGRLKGVAYTGSPDQLKAVADLPVGESDLVHRDGMWFLYATVEVPEPELIDPDGFLGVDLGIANIAYDSDGTRYAGTRLNGYRRRQLRLRQRLQAKGTKSARRLLARRRKKEARHAANVNHSIAKTIVTEAARTGRGIAVEELTGIRDRVRLRKPQRVTLSLVVVPPARRVPGLQGPPGRCTAGRSRPPVHLPDLRPVRAPRQAEPARPGNLHLPVVRGRCPRRPQCGPQHRPARCRGLGRSQPPTRGLTSQPARGDDPQARPFMGG